MTPNGTRHRPYKCFLMLLKPLTQVYYDCYKKYSFQVTLLAKTDNILTSSINIPLTHRETPPLTYYVTKTNTVPW